MCVAACCQTTHLLVRDVVVLVLPSGHLAEHQEIFCVSERPNDLAELASCGPFVERRCSSTQELFTALQALDWGHGRGLLPLASLDDFELANETFRYVK